MKKRRLPTTYTAAQTKSVKKQEEKPKTNPKNILEDEEDENSGFSKWMRTGEGVEFMKYFVILNSLGVFITMGWPSISKCYQIIKSFFVDEEESV